jgi:hypothetical protein
VDKKTGLVIKGFLALTKSQQAEVEKVIKGYEERGTITEEVKKNQTEIGMGPLGTSCPCCGR